MVESLISTNGFNVPEGCIIILYVVTESKAASVDVGCVQEVIYHISKHHILCNYFINRVDVEHTGNQCVASK